MKTSGIVALTLALTFSAACGDKNDATEGTDTTAAMTGAAAGAIENAFKVSDLELGRTVGADNKISDATDNFKPNDTIIAVVETDGSASGQTLVARWTFEDGQLVEEQTQTVSATGGKSYTQFKLSKPSGWPVGKYKVVVMMNNNEVESEEFEVKN
jgi:hypothetical protein